MRCLCGGIANKVKRRKPVIFGKSVVIIDCEVWACSEPGCRFEFGDIETAAAIQRKLLDIMDKKRLKPEDVKIIKGGRNRTLKDGPTRHLIKEIKDGKEN